MEGKNPITQKSYEFQEGTILQWIYDWKSLKNLLTKIKKTKPISKNKPIEIEQFAMTAKRIGEKLIG